MRERTQSLKNLQGKDNKLTEFNKVYSALFEKPSTMKEVFVRTGVLREFVCWYCRELRLTGRLFKIRERECTITKRIVNEYTVNSSDIDHPISIQSDQVISV